MEPDVDRSVGSACPRAWPWGILLAYVALLAIGIPQAGLQIGASQLASAAIWLGASGGLCLLRSRLTGVGVGRFIDFMETCAVFCAICMAGALASYVMAAMSQGYVDGALAQADRWLGFDWPAAYRLTAAHPMLQISGRWAYASIFLTPIAVLAWLCAAGRDDRARRFIVAYGVALMVTVVALLWFSAVGPLDHYAIGEVSYHTATGSRHVAIIEDLRAGRLNTIDLRAIEGLVSVPSFHAATALLLMWAAWPLPRARWLFVLVNLAMLAATPVEGNHYVIDLAFGLVLAVVVIAFTNQMLVRRSQSAVHLGEELLIRLRLA